MSVVLLVKALLLSFCSVVRVLSFEGAVNHESRLLTDMFDGYNRHARPIVDVNNPVNVTISFYLTKILGLDEKNQVLTTFGWLEVHWTDEFMQWDPREYGGVSRIIVPPDLIWLPDFGLENSADTIYDDQADKKFRAGVNSDGYIQWVPGGKFITSCQLDITMYPFDHQECEMDFVDWTYDGRFVMLLNGSDAVGLDVYKKHGEWEIVNTKSFNTNQYFDSDPGIPFPTVKFVYYLKRKPKFYLINVVAPCILMSVLASLVFYLPPESGEKVSLGITVLLSFSVFLLLIAENVPKTSDCVPLIGIYLTMVMVMTGCSIVISVIVLDLHHHEAFSPVPVWLKRIVFSCMARMLCMHTPYTVYREAGRQSGSTHTGQTRFNRNSTRSYGNHSSLMSAGLTTDDEESVNMQQTTQQPQQQQDNVDGMNNVVKGFYDELEALMAPRRKRPILEEMLQHLREITNKMRKNIKKDHIKSEWKLVAKVLDRFLLILFLVSVSAFTLYILYIYPRTMMPPVTDIGP